MAGPPGPGSTSCCRSTDIRIASAEHARFKFALLTQGWLGHGPGAALLAKQLRYIDAMKILLTDEPFDAAEALRIGLVNEVVPHAQLMERAEKIARHICTLPPVAVRMMKEFVVRFGDLPTDQAWHIQNLINHLLIQTTTDGEEGRAGVQRKAPAQLHRHAASPRRAVGGTLRGRRQALRRGLPQRGVLVRIPAPDEAGNPVGYEGALSYINVTRLYLPHSTDLAPGCERMDDQIVTRPAQRAPSLPPQSAQAVRPHRWRGRRLWLVAVLISIVVASGAAWWWIASRGAAMHYTTAPVTRGTVARTVTATGTINPVLTIIVGSYVSGVIQSLQCDYNTKVTKGQVCAKIDPRPFQAVVDQYTANLAVAKAQLREGSGKPRIHQGQFRAHRVAGQAKLDRYRHCRPVAERLPSGAGAGPARPGGDPAMGSPAWRARRSTLPTPISFRRWTAPWCRAT